MTLADVGAAARAVGLALRGGFALTAAEQVGPLAASRTIALLGFVGAQHWPEFAASPEARDGAAHSLDRWSRRVVTALAARFGALPLFPFEGPPYWPFQRWARRAEPLHPSPLGMLIHPQYGLWHSYRGALAFAQTLDLPPPADIASPCATCADRPCLSACPVGAFTTAGYDVAACADLLRRPGGGDCMGGGCLARRACPVGREFAPSQQQAAFYMRAFLAARK
jgi:hypothetical protein